MIDIELSNSIIIELVEDCKLVRSLSIENGHDCWGNLEWTEQKIVYIDGKQENCWDGWWVVHDGKEVLDVLPNSMKPDESTWAKKANTSAVYGKTDTEVSEWLDKVPEERYDIASALEKALRSSTAGTRRKMLIDKFLQQYVLTPR
jgi:hypothetical protein